MPLEFDTARVSVPAAPQRTDITCFVGFVRGAQCSRCPGR